MPPVERSEHSGSRWQPLIELVGSIRSRLKPGGELPPSEEIPSPEKVSPTEEDRVWSAFMERRRDWRELVALLKDEQLKPEYQRRILQVLFAPSVKELPFPVNMDSDNYLFLSAQWRAILSRAQAAYAAGLIETHIPQVAGRSDIDSEDALMRYNEKIRILLPILPQERAESLFAYFFWLNLNGPNRQYGPLESLFLDEVIEEFWKEKAAEGMHEVIQREQRSEVPPRNKWEVAAQCYGNILDRLVARRGENLPVSREFFQREIGFMLSIDTGRPIVDFCRTREAMDLLDDGEVRHNFARRQVLTGDEDRLRIYNEETVEIAGGILTEFPEDRELRTYLERELKEYQVRFEQPRQRGETRATKEQEILEMMRLP